MGRDYISVQLQDMAKQIWFPAKRYGWGWGPPNCWQGWVVLAVYLGLVIGSAFYFRAHTVPYVACVFGLSAILILVCQLKGEPPKWRWGGKDEQDS